MSRWHVYVQCLLCAEKSPHASSANQANAERECGVWCEANGWTFLPAAPTRPLEGWMCPRCALDVTLCVPNIKTILDALRCEILDDPTTDLGGAREAVDAMLAPRNMEMR